MLYLIATKAIINLHGVGSYSEENVIDAFA